MKKIIIFASVILIIAAIVPILPTAEDREIYEKTLRLHILAASDSEEDQAVKLKVRDAVLDLLADDMAGTSSREEAAELVGSKEAEIIAAAEAVMRNEGISDSATLSLTEEYYPRREYEGVRLPAGKYLSLQIKLGESRGQNWWCVLFPTLCTSAAKPRDELIDAGFTVGQVRLITDSESPRYRLKFRLLEFLMGR